MQTTSQAQLPSGPASRSLPSPTAPAATVQRPRTRRSAISRDRAAACPLIRLATFAHAISSTIATSTPSAIIARSIFVLQADTPDRQPASAPLSTPKSSPPLLRGLEISSASRFASPAALIRRIQLARERLHLHTRICQHIGAELAHPVLHDRIHHRRGTNMSVTVPGSVPVNPFGPTPTISYTPPRPCGTCVPIARRVAPKPPRPVVIRDHRIRLPVPRPQ